jgi:hypothetical protein
LPGPITRSSTSSPNGHGCPAIKVIVWSLRAVSLIGR